jgi:endonuclease I
MRNAILLVAFLAFRAAPALADAYDPPANYYNAATGTGATLKAQLNDIIDNHTVLSYDSARSNLQVTDADPTRPGYMLTVYDRTSVHVAAINPGGPIPGWDNAATWNREHVWPKSRGPGESGPDQTDLFELRPALTENNGDRGNANFGGAFGQPWGLVTDNGASQWYPGDVEAGMIARQAFYMDTRYDGVDGGTTNLTLLAGNPSTSAGMGDLNRLVQWNYLAPPDQFERRRNQIIYDQFQHNRNPFTDRPEWVWAVFVDNANDTRLTLAGTTPGADGSSSRTIDYGRVLVGAPTPGTQSVTFGKAGVDGTYFSVTAAGAATSSLTGRYNAFAIGPESNRTLQAGLSTSTATAGLKSGTITIDNLDVTTAGGVGRGANDGNDVVSLQLAVIDHAEPAFASGASQLTIDFGALTLGDVAPEVPFDVFNLMGTAGFTAAMDFDLVSGTGDLLAFSTNLPAAVGDLLLPAGESRSFLATMDTSTAGDFAASYSLVFSDENLPGAATLDALTLNLVGTVTAAPVETADFDNDGDVDGADLLAWQRGVSLAEGATRGDGDATGDGAVDAADLAVWTGSFEEPPERASVPEPASGAMAWILAMTVASVARRLG